MNYSFKTDISEQEYTEFIKNSNSVSFMQEYNWGDIKTDWNHKHCGLYLNGNLIGVCLILIRTLPMGIKLFYIPRGFVIDFTDQKAVEVFTSEIKALAKKEKAYSIKIDPYFCAKEYSYKEVEKNCEEIIPTHYSIDYKMKHKNILAAGFKHHGFSLKINDTQQPRFNMSIPLIDVDKKPLSIDEIKKSFKKRVRDYLGNYHQNRGVFFEHTNDINKLDDFMEIINETENRQNIVLRNKEYFEKIMKKFDAYLFFGKLDLTKYLTFLKDKGKEQEIKQVEELIEKGNKIINLSAALVILPQNKNGIRTSEYLYAGNNLLFSKLNVSYGIVFDICKFSLENNCSFLNLGGVEGSLDDHLTTFKGRFNAIIWEFAGEYDYIINKIMYYPIEKLMPIAKKIYRKIHK